MQGRNSQTSTILVVEDDPKIQQGLEMNLRLEGYSVLTADDGERGLQLAVDKQPDLILLDIMLPNVNGYEICKTIRKNGISCPIIMITAKSEEMDKLIGFDLGADDYITKPFSLREVLARVNAQLRRKREYESAFDGAKFGPFVIDLRGRSLRRGKNDIELSSKEFDLLIFFLQNEGTALSRSEILNRVWGYDYYGTDRTVDNFINKLRTKIEDKPEKPTYITTVRNIGYKFIADVTFS
ncbi:MAG: response regulator transcription factor [Planctomycetes bacterium]|nr:response regulator transcription factor [Planctomycetota bacterium]